MKITIRDAAGNSAAADTLGAELKSFRTGGAEYIWQGDPRYWSGSAPFLFPIASNARQDTLYIEGKPYHMPMHGFAKDLEWEVGKQSEDCVTFLLRQTAETLASYPFRFTMEAKYAIAGGMLTMTMTIRNDDTREMPYCFGTHPAFNVPFDPAAGSSFADYRIEFEKEEENSCPLYDGAARQIDVNRRESFLEPDNRTLRLDYDVFARVDTVIFDHMNSRSAALIDGKTGRKLTLGYPTFDYAAVWTKPGAPYVCIEPWQGLSACSDEDDNMLSKRGVKCLKPGESDVYVLTFAVTE